MENKLEKIVSWAKRRGFVMPGSMKISRRGLLILSVIALILVGGLFWLNHTGRIHTFADIPSGPYSINGKITDRSGSPLSGVTVTDNLGRSTTSSADGVYHLTSLPANDLTVTFAKDGTSWYNDVNRDFARSKGIQDNNQIAESNKQNVYAAIAARIMSLQFRCSVNPCSSSSPTLYYVFNPTEQVTRAQMAVAISRSLGLAKSAKSNPSHPVFTDVPSTYWAFDQIEALYFDDTVGGYPDGTFRPEEKINRAQLAVFISKALKMDISGPPISSFSDMPSPAYDWAIPAVEVLKSEGIVQGYPDGTYRPNDIITREQLATYLVRSFKNIPATKGGYDKISQQFYLSIGGTTYAKTYDLAMIPCGSYGKVWGTLKDTSGNPIIGARIILTLGPDSHEEYTRTSRAGGAYNFFNIPEGSFAYFVSKKDSADLYKTENWENAVYVEAGKITSLDLSNLQ